MAASAQEVLTIALKLIGDEDASGELTSRALDIMNVLTRELFRYSDTFAANAAVQPSAAALTVLTDELPLDEALCRAVLPYGLAAHLLIDSDPAAASFFQQRYEELIVRVGMAVPSASEAIGDIYGGLGCR